MDNIFVDLHTDFVLACYEKGDEYGSSKQINRGLLHKTGVRVLFGGFSYDDLFGDTERQFQIMRDVAKEHQDFSIITSKKDFENIFALPQQTGIIMHMEGAEVLHSNPGSLHEYYKKGLRSLGLTHSDHNSLAGGNKSDPIIPLSAFGKRVIKNAQQLGIIVDLAHLNKKGFYQALDLISTPPFVSHANTYAVCPDPRNLTDEQIKEVASRKGIIGVFFSQKYVRQHSPVTIDDVVDHCVQIAEVGGIDILSIGSDFGGITTGLPKGLENTGKLPMLLKKLRAKGFSDSDVQRVSHLNAIRVIKQLLH